MSLWSPVGDRRAAVVPNCCCNLRIAAVRVLGGAPDDDPDAANGDGSVWDVVFGRDGNGTTNEFGGGMELDGAVAELDMGAVLVIPDCQVLGIDRGSRSAGKVGEVRGHGGDGKWTPSWRLVSRRAGQCSRTESGGVTEPTERD
jgi:hypothetical protein